MSEALLAAFGAVCALVASAPTLAAFEAGMRDSPRADVALGLAAVAGSFLLGTALLYGAHRLAGDGFPVAAAGFIAAYLAAWAVASVRAWRRMSGRE